MIISVLDGFLVNPGDISWQPIGAQGELVLHDETDPCDTAAHIGNADAVYTNRCNITAEVMDACPNLKFISTFGTGFNMIDIDAAKKRGITVSNVPAYSTFAVAQMAAAHLLQIANNTARFDAYLKQQGWQSSLDRNLTAIPTMELCGKTLGIIGLGNIGRNMAKICRALGMNIIAYKRHTDTPDKDGIPFVTLDELYAKSDVISIHCPLNDDSRAMINAAAIAKMKDGVIIINTARGAVLNDEDVAAALDSGKIYALGTDVFAPEPCGKEHILARNPRCVATPHMGWAPKQTRERLIDLCAANLKAFIEGNPINKIV